MAYSVARTALELQAVVAVIVAQLALLSPVHGNSGSLTFYGGAGIGGFCSSTFNYDGFTTVAMNAAQYQNGYACGGCVSGCFRQVNGQQRCFQAIVDNKCPECSQGDLDLGENGSGRLPVTWKFIKCPDAKMQFSTQGSNPYYAKLKIEGAGMIRSVTCDGNSWSLTSDGFWQYAGNLNCRGPVCNIKRASGKIVQKTLSPSLFGC